MIISTKLHIPQIRSSLVSRPRLMRKLHHGMKTKITLVSAQAGYGKTTALCEWVNESTALVAWVSLDKQDNDWIQFWSYITASIGERVPGFGQTVVAFLEKGPTVNQEPAINALLNELNGLTSELSLILDDFHVIELPSIQHSLSYLLEHLPPHLHLYIASRSELSIPTARLLAKGEMNPINIQDLRFQLEEGIVFFRDKMDLILTQEQVAELFHQTEGWVSGLKLAAISLRRSDNIAESIHQFSGQQHNISDYLLEEVLRHQSESMRAFLLETSILSRMNRSLCEAVTGQTNSQEQLERLDQLNLFIIPLDDQRNWYRYHQLFSEFLQRILSTTNQGRWIQAHINAAQWLENAGFDEEAVEHFLEGKQFGDAIRLMEKNLQSLMQSKSVVLYRWVSVLPENSFAEKPMIEMFYISVLLGIGEWDTAFRRVKQAELLFHALQDRMPASEWNQVMGNIYFFCAVIAYLQKDLVQTSAYFDLVEHYMPQGSLFQTMGRNRYQGFDSFDDHLALINNLHEADAFLQHWIKVWEGKKEYPFIGYLYASYSKLLYEWNRLDEAEFYVNQALRRNDIQPYARIVIHITISASRIQQAKGNVYEASELLTQLKLQIDSPDNEQFIQKIEAEQAHLSMRQQSVQDGVHWLQSSGLSHMDEVSLSSVPEHLAMARVLAASGQSEDALHLLGRLYHLLSKEDRLRDRIKVLLLQSVTLQQEGQSSAAFVPLEKALQLAEPEGYIRSFVDEGKVLADLLNHYSDIQGIRRRDVPPLVSIGYIKQLLQAVSASQEEELSFKEILTGQEMRILQLITQGLSNKEIANSLSITGETVKSHIKNVYRKLRVNNRVQALQKAKELQLLV